MRLRSIHLRHLALIEPEALFKVPPHRFVELLRETALDAEERVHAAGVVTPSAVGELLRVGGEGTHVVHVSGIGVEPDAVGAEAEVGGLEGCSGGK